MSENVKTLKEITSDLSRNSFSKQNIKAVISVEENKRSKKEEVLYKQLNIKSFPSQGEEYSMDTKDLT